MNAYALIGLSRHRIGMDGAGVTTLVAFHGCPLSCKHCLNPDHWIVDIKDMSPSIYRAYTGADNSSVFNNLRHLIDKKAKITVRVPLIPNFNTEADVERSIETLQEMGITDTNRFTYTIKEH